MFTNKAVVAWLEAWCREHLGNEESPGFKGYVKEYHRALTAKRTEQLLPHDNKGAFGMSSAAGCMRRAAWKRAGKQEEFTGSDRVVFEVGHLLEAKVLAILRAGGWQIPETQIAANLRPVFYSASDGLIVESPVHGPAVLSIKTASWKSSTFSPKYGAKRHGFAAYPLDGLEVAQPGNYAQAQLEMLAHGIPQALVIVLAKDMIAAFSADPIMQESGSLCWYAETIPFDRPYAESLKQGYETILPLPPQEVPPIVVHGGKGQMMCLLPSPGDTTSGWGGANQQATGNFNPCFKCSFAALCRKGGTA